ncbi:MAG: hypothetical protein ACXWCG_04075 [Flavitalea sp.]
MTKEEFILKLPAIITHHSYVKSHLKLQEITIIEKLPVTSITSDIQAGFDRLLPGTICLKN